MGPDNSDCSTMTSTLKVSGLTILQDMVNRQFEIENLGALESDPAPSSEMTMGPKKPDLWTPEERVADSLMTITRKVSRGLPFYEGKIPWRSNHHSRLVGNFGVVLQRQNRTHSVESLKKKGILTTEVDSIITSYQDKGYIEPVPKEEEGSGWYLPFFEVVNRQKSTPIRLVFDAKAKYKGTSLNQQILDTPNRLSDLTLVLSRMRTYRFVLAGDIAEMFLQIRLHEDDKQFHLVHPWGQTFPMDKSLIWEQGLTQHVPEST